MTKIFSVLRCQLLPGPGSGLASKLHVVLSGECEERDWSSDGLSLLNYGSGSEQHG